MARKIWTGPDERGRLAQSLITLYDQADALWPNRDHSSDGSIGDPAHQARVSDHNPSGGIVRALDITHDPRNGLDAHRLADLLLEKRDKRWRYIISNGRIAYDEVAGPKNGAAPFTWTRYSGDNPHNHHIHISVDKETQVIDNPAPWDIGGAPTSPQPQAPASLPRIHLGDTGPYVEILQRALGITVDGDFGPQTDAALRRFQEKNGLEVDGWCGPYTWSKLGIAAQQGAKINRDIIATRFGGLRDPNNSAYDNHFLTDVEPGAALPFRFVGERPLLWARSKINGALVENIPIIDVGPIYPHPSRGPADPYWETGARPRAETTHTLSEAGIDFLPLTANKLGITEELGKGLVDWGFMEQKTMDPEIAKLTKAIEELAKVVDAIMVKVGMKPTTTPPVQVPPTQPDENQPVLEKPGVATSIGVGILGFIAQLLGLVGTPAVVGTNPTDAGTAVTILPALSALFGMAGGWRGIMKLFTR